MAEQLLNGADVRTVVQQVRGKRVSQSKTASSLVSFSHVAQGAGGAGGVLVDAGRVGGPFDGADVVERRLQHGVVQEGQRIQRLVLGRGRDVAVRRKMIQEGPHVRLVEMTRVRGVVKANEAGT